MDRLQPHLHDGSPYLLAVGQGAFSPGEQQMATRTRHRRAADTLPRIDQRGPANVADVGPDELNAPREYRLLLVDGFSDEAALYSEFFSSCGFQVEICAQADDAFQEALSEPPDVIVTLLWQTSGPSEGIQLAGRLRRASLTRDVPIVIMTTSILPTDVRAAQQAGCNRILLLPITPEELLDEIQAVVRLSQRNR